jgi:multidrug efflux pump
MNLTDIFIRRPVLATTVSLLIVVLGLRSLFSLPINQYPRTQNAVVTISTTYYGADAQTVGGFITQPLESAIAQAQGIDYLSSSSTSGVSTITATLRLNYDANRALTEINTGFDPGGSDRRTAGRPAVCAARLAGFSQNGGARRHRSGCQHGHGQQ